MTTGASATDPARRDGLPLTVILPANNEAGWLRPCLEAVLAQDAPAWPLRIVVSANACTDGTEEIARAMAPAFAGKGGELIVISSPEPGKLGALNRADHAVSAMEAEAGAGQGPRAYLDADVICDAALLGQIRAALATEAPRYATGTIAVTRATTAVTRAYAGIWTRLPFVEDGAVGAGLFAVNPAGRARWGDFPDIISDDTFVRLNFTPAERIEVPARYHWPMVEGFARLVKVRRRQDAGVTQLRALYPSLMENEGKSRLTRGRLMRLALTRPMGFATYMAVHLAVRMRGADAAWTRGR